MFFITLRIADGGWNFNFARRKNVVRIGKKINLSSAARCEQKKHGRSGWHIKTVKMKMNVFLFILHLLKIIIIICFFAKHKIQALKNENN